MSQDNPQISTTPPLPGLQLVQDMNKALQTLATDFAGSTDPAAMAWPYSTWADTGTGALKRRNAANSAWVIEGRLLRSHLPIYALADIPAQDIGPIYIIGKGPTEWGGASYPIRSSIPGATFAELDAATADQGPAICLDMGGYLYKWVETAYFSGYRNVRIGGLPDTFATITEPWWMPMTGGVWSESDPKQRRLIAWFREQGQVMAAIDWAKGWGRIADLGGGDWKAVDAQDGFKRWAGTDRDTANPAGPGHYQPDATKSESGSFTARSGTAGGSLVYDGAGVITTANASGVRQSFSESATQVLASIISIKIGSSVETRGAASRVLPVVLV